MKKKILQLLGMVLFVGLLAGCGSNNEKTVVFSDAGWDSVKFHKGLWFKSRNDERLDADYGSGTGAR